LTSSAPLRVLIDYRAALRNRSGAGEYAHELARALLARGRADPAGAIALSLFSSSWKDRLQLAEPLRGAHTTDRHIPVSILNFLWHRLEWPPVERLTGETYDVVQSAHPLLTPSVGAAQVVTIHDLDFLAHPERTQAEVRRDYPSLVRHHAARADKILVPSRYTLSQVERQLGVPAERIAVCPPGAPDWTARSVGPANGYVLFMGTLEPRKNVGSLLDAYERLLADPALSLPPLLLAGGARPEAAEWLRRVGEPPLAGHVSHRGYVAPGDREALYRGAVALVVPSLDEGFGIPVLEAMTAGVPVVAANRGALPEVLAGAGVLVDPLNSADLAHGLRRMTTDHELVATCVARGIARARDFDWADTAARVHEAYREAVRHRQSRAY